MVQGAAGVDMCDQHHVLYHGPRLLPRLWRPCPVARLQEPACGILAEHCHVCHHDPCHSRHSVLPVCVYDEDRVVAQNRKAAGECD